MATKKAHETGRGEGSVTGEFSQIFLYRVPKVNHDAFGEVEGELAAIFHGCGVLHSESYVLTEARVFGGFQDVRVALAAKPDEEVWVEIDTYRDVADSARVIANIGKDPAAGPLFAQVLQLATPGVLCLQGNAERMHPQGT